MRTINRHGWVVAALFAATFGVSVLAHPAPAPSSITFETIPMALAGRAGTTAPPLAPDAARILSADQYLHRYYARADAPLIEMDIAYYSQPRVGATAHSPLNCLPGNGWTMSEPMVRQVESAAGRWTVREVTVSRGSARWAMAYWFQNRQRVDYNEFSARWHVFTDALRRERSDTAMIRVMTPVGTEDVSSRAAVASFAGELIPQVQRALATAR